MKKNRYLISENEKLGLWDFAQMLIDKNRILDAIPILIKCENRAIKGGGGDCLCLNDGGAFDFIVYLMNNCKRNQTNQIDYLMDECFPNMIRDWIFNVTLVKYRLYMHRRFGDNGLYTTLHKIDIDKQKGKLPENFIPYWKKKTKSIYKFKQ